VTTSPGERIFRAFREFQRLNRFISVDSAAALSLAAAHAIIEIDAHPGIDIGSLAAILEMPRTSLAAVLRSLKRQRLVSVTKSKVDSRRRSLKITAKGLALVRYEDPIIDAHLVWVLSPLGPAEEPKVASLVREIADGMGTPPCQPREHEHPVRNQLRRATRALRLIHADFMGTSLGSPEWQVLSKVAEKGSYKSISDVANELSLQLSTATTICARLRERGYLKSTTSSHDRRAATISLTRAGEDFLKASEGAAASRIERAVANVPSDRLMEEISVFEKVVTARREGDSVTG